MSAKVRKATADSIKGLLRSQKVTQRDLAARVDLSEARMSRILSGHENLTLDTIDKLASALDVEIVLTVRRPATGALMGMVGDIRVARGNFRAAQVLYPNDPASQRRYQEEMRQIVAVPDTGGGLLSLSVAERLPRPLTLTDLERTFEAILRRPRHFGL